MAPTDEQKKAAQLRSAAQGWLTRSMANVDLVIQDENSDRIDFEAAIAELNKRLDNFEQAQAQVEAEADIDNLNQELERAAAIYDNAHALRKKANKLLQKKIKQDDDQSSSNSSGNGSARSVKLPKLELPKFSGDVTKFPEFWDQFYATVDQQSDLPTVSKFTYLKSLLEGEAKSSIEGLTLTEANYNAACKLLQDRFGRKELIIFSHIQSLLSLEGHGSNDLAKLKGIQDQVLVHVRSLESLGIDGNTYGMFLTPLILSRLPSGVRMEWAREGEGHEGDLPWLLKFLKTEIERRERADTFNTKHTKPDDTKKEEKRKSGPRGPATATSLHNATDVGCAFCGRSNHKSVKCRKLKMMSVQERHDAVKRVQRCFKCLSADHMARSCSATCSECNGYHHKLLCLRKPAVSSDSQQSQQSADDGKSGASTSVSCMAQSVKQSVVLQTARVTIKGPECSSTINVLFDSGSDRTYIRQDVAQNLKLKQVDMIDHRYATFGGNKSKASKKSVKSVNLLGLAGQSCSIKAIEVPVICSPLVRPHIPQEALYLPGVTYAQADSNGSIKVDVLIGLDYYWSLMGSKIIKMECESLVAQESIFGFVLSGKSTSAGSKEVTSHQLLCLNDISEDHLRRFWDLDHIGIKPQEKEPEDPILSKFDETIQFKDGRYEVALPWKDVPIKLENNEKSASARLASLTRRFKTDPELQQRYDGVLSELEDQGIIEQVPDEEINVDNSEENRVFYLPHHPIVRESRSSTKVRPVFDGSAKGPNGISLNDCLESGPSLLPNLVAVLIRFRRWLIALVADITKAFLQVGLQASDRDVHRFLWMCNGKVRVMRFKRVTFGVNSSPFLLNATIKFHLKQYSELLKQPVIKELEENLYVDDWLTGADYNPEAYILYEQGTSVMGDAGMSLAKWQTNDVELIDKSGDELCKDDDQVKVLGLGWSKADDCFIFNGIDLPSDLIITKRLILSMIARIFDPLGLLNPFVMVAKILFQKTWQLGVEWDSEVPEDLAEKFQVWLEGIPLLKQWKVDRRYSSVMWSQNVSSVELYAFGDASESGYGAAIYAKFPNDDQGFGTSLIISKAKVAPIKKVTLPRLELLSCLLAARLLSFVKEALSLMDAKYFCMTDSKVALGWIKGNPLRWKQFVANRVTEIQALTDPKNWFHCPGKENPADLLTRGIMAEQLVGCEDLWLRPPVLYKCLPDELNIEDGLDIDIPEESKSCRSNLSDNPVLTAASQAVKDSEPLIEVKRFSSFNKAVRVTAWVRRFVHNVKASEKQYGVLAHDELSQAKIVLLKQSQKQSFSDELEKLVKGEGVPKSSKLFPLTPYLDEDGLIRVKGRLDNTDLSYETKHPIILEADWMALLMVRQEHLQLKHGGVNTVLTAIRNQYWIVKVRRLAKSVIFSCLPCQRLTAKSCNQEGAQLPSNRIKQQVPFCNTGIDYAGPLYCIDVPGQKYYVCLFTCAVIRAIHLELTSSLTSMEFVCVFRKFASRRGLPHNVQSDNAKTFVGAQPALNKTYGDKCPEWSYITPRSPWHGGYWERLVRSVKTALKKSIQGNRLTRMELETVLTEIEMAINSRPLTFVSDEIDANSPLTPNHFLLVGHQLQCSSPLDVKALAIEQRRVLQVFWKQWTDDYIRNLPCMVPQFSERGKINIGSVVLVREDNTTRLQWPLGRVTDMFPSTDGKIRSVRVKTSNNELVRPVQRLHLLEMVSGETEGSAEMIDTHQSEQSKQSCRSNQNPSEETNHGKQSCRSSLKQSKETELGDQSRRSKLNPVNKLKAGNRDCVISQNSEKVQPEIKTRAGRTVRKPQKTDL